MDFVDMMELASIASGRFVDEVKSWFALELSFSLITAEACTYPDEAAPLDVGKLRSVAALDSPEASCAAWSVTIEGRDSSSGILSGSNGSNPFIAFSMLADLT